MAESSECKFTSGDIVEVICCDCGCKAIRKFRPQRHKIWRCMKCGIKNAKNNNKYIGSTNRQITNNTRNKLSQKSSNNWQDIIYRNTITQKSISNAVRKPKIIKILCPQCGNFKNVVRRKVADLCQRVCRKCAMTNKWNDPQYRAKISLGQAIISKKLWSDPAYSKKVALGNSSVWSLRKLELSNRSKELWKNYDYRTKMADALSQQLKQPSSIQRQLYKYLDDLNINYEIEYPLGFYVFDCFIPDRKLLIECQGDYWHSLPKAECKDKSKFTYIKNYFPDHEVIYFWEHEFHTVNKVLDRLKNKLDIAVDIIDFEFSDIIIKPPDNKELKSFLDTYHYIGKSRGGKCFGAYLGNELVACAVYSPPLRQNIACQFDLKDNEVLELSRLCIHPNYQKKNLASWLISKTIKLVDCKLVISYADTTVGHTGIVYKAANFKLHHAVPSDYWYTDGNGYVMHKRTLYGKAVKMSMREAEYAEKYGYSKKYGGEKLCYVYCKDASVV